MKIDFEDTRGKSEIPIGKVDVDDDDVYDLFVTLASIIHPCLVRFKKTSAEGPSCFDTDLEDVSEQFWDLSMWIRWSIVLDKMIFAFELILKDDVPLANEKDIEEGLRLFGKYFRKLWI